MKRSSSQIWEGFLRDIGGKYAGDPRAFAYFVPLAWLLSMVGFDYAGETWAFTARMLANAIAFASCYGILFIIRRTLFRDRERRTVPLVTVIGAGAALGGLKVVITLILTSSLTGDWGDLGSSVVRVSAGAFTGAWFLPIAAAILATQDRYRTVRDVVFAQRWHRGASSVAERIADPAQVKLSGLLDEVRQTINVHSNSPESMAESLTAMLEKKIRPFSRDLWSKSGRKTNDRSALELVRIVLARTAYWPSLTTIGVVAISAPLIVSTVGWGEGIIRLMILGASAWGALIALHRARPTTASQGALLLTLAAGTYSGTNEAIVHALFGQFGDFSALVDLLLNASLFAILAVLAGILRLTRDELQELEKEMSIIFDDSYFSGRVDLERLRMRQRELAHLIHGRLQNQILGAVLALTKNPESTSPQDLLDEIDRLETEISSPQDVPERNTTAILDDQLEQLSRRWAGIVDVSISPDFPEAMRGEDVMACVAIAEEGITNALRHGLASAVTITLGEDRGNWSISVIDNGVGPRNGPPGLGTMTLAHHAGKSWSLSPGPSGIGSALVAHIPVGRTGREPVTDRL